MNTSKPFSTVHWNSIDVLGDGSLLLSARNTWTLYKVDQMSGKILWRLGGKRSDFTLDRNARFAWRHDARRHHDSRISVFDGEAAPAARSQSRALFLTVDESTMQMSVTRQ